MENRSVTANDVKSALQKFFTIFSEFRKNNNLNKGVDNPHESFTGMTDKNARIGRQMKHFFRGDSKPDWPAGAGEALMGYMAYVHLLFERILKEADDPEVLIDALFDGVEQELKSMTKQYST